MVEATQFFCSVVFFIKTISINLQVICGDLGSNPIYILYRFFLSLKISVKILATLVGLIHLCGVARRLSIYVFIQHTF